MRIASAMLYKRTLVCVERENDGLYQNTPRLSVHVQSPSLRVLQLSFQRFQREGWVYTGLARSTVTVGPGQAAVRSMPAAKTPRTPTEGLTAALSRALTPVARAESTGAQHAQTDHDARQTSRSCILDGRCAIISKRTTTPSTGMLPLVSE